MASEDAAYVSGMCVFVLPMGGLRLRKRGKRKLVGQIEGLIPKRIHWSERLERVESISYDGGKNYVSIHFVVQFDKKLNPQKLSKQISKGRQDGIRIKKSQHLPPNMYPSTCSPKRPFEMGIEGG